MTVASAQFLDIQELVSPLAGENPGGDPRAYVRDLRSQFAEFRNPPICTNPDDPAASAAPAEPDWKAIRDLAVESLRTRTKDVRIACHLAEAEMHLHGLAGLASGLQIILSLLSDGWDFLIPELDPEDPEVRSSPIENLLNDPDRGPCLPQTLKAIPIVGEGDRAVSYQDAMRRGASDEDKNRVAVAISSCTAETGRELLGQYQLIQQLIGEIQSTLDQKLEANAPSLTNLSESVEMIGRWLINCFGTADGDSSANSAHSTDSPETCEGSTNVGGNDGDGTGGFPTGYRNDFQTNQQDPASILRLSVQMRNEAYRKLTEAATVLQQIEPHSPIPYMIHRAVRLGQMPFPDLVGKLVREESALQALRGEFGLPSEEENV